MRLIADRQLTGEYGTVSPGHEFEVRDEIAGELVGRGLARVAGPPRIEYEVKVVVPAEAPEVSAREPFRDLLVPDQEPQELVAESDRVLPETDVLEPEATDSFRRPGRARSAARR